MKKTLAVLLILVLTLLGPCACAEDIPAEENRYIHPTKGYTFPVPEGWLVVDAENIDGCMDALGKGELVFPALDAPTLNDMKPRFQQLDCAMLFDPHGNNAVFVTESLGNLWTSEQFAATMIPALKAQFTQQHPDIEFTSEGEILPMGENEFITLSGTYHLNGAIFSLDQLYTIDKTRVHCISLTVNDHASPENINLFFREIVSVLTAFSITAL